MSILEHFDQLRDDADAAMDKIGNDPNRIAELGDDDLTALALQMKAAWPLLETHLVALCGGDIDAANAALAHVEGFGQGKLVKLYRAGYAAIRAKHRNPSRNQLAALLLNVQTGVGAIQVEQERRQAVKAGAVN